MKRFEKAFLVASAVCLSLMTASVALAQAGKVAIKIEAMTPHRLAEIGQPDPGDHSYISSGLRSVGVGSFVWLSAWDVTGDTAYIVGSSYSWVLSVPGGSSASIDNPSGQLVKFQPDVAGQYTATVTLDGKDTSVVIRAATYIGVDRNSVLGSQQNCRTCHESATPTIYNNWAASGHAKKFEFGMDGINGSYWGPSCYPCHTTGFNTNTLANNGGFDDVATAVGFDLSDSSASGHWLPLRVGNYDSLLTTTEAPVTAVGGITCENCHGPFNTAADHYTVKQPKSLDPNMCGQCHDEPWRHNRNAQWNNSGHAEPPWSNSFSSSGSTEVTNYTLNACVRCHDGGGFIQFTKGESFDNRRSSGYSIITRTEIVCATCHDPHNVNKTDHGLRTAPSSSDTLANGFAYSASDFGTGLVCANCHKYRREAESYVASQSSVRSSFGPHHLGSADVWLGQNGIEYGQSLTRKSAHQMLITESCVQCHMSATPDTGTAARDKIGGHSWSMEYTDAGSGITYDNVTGCVGCHGPITSFDDIKGIDYDMDGTIEPTMHEVDGLLDKVAMALPPVGSPTIDYAQIDANPADSAKFRKALWNYKYVTEGRDRGAHNPKYTIGLLQTTLNQLTGVEFVNSEIPNQFELAQNYPNPFNPTTEITFALPKAGPVMLEVYDLTGRVVSTLVNQDLPAGTHKVVWNARSSNGQSLASGVYLYRIATGDFVATRKMVLLK